MPSVHVVVDFFGVKKMLQECGFDTNVSIDECDFLQFTGGGDINPNLYNYEQHSKTYVSDARDSVEVRAFNRARYLHKPMAGICRGAQLIHALNGGKLWQHVNGHGGTHSVFSTETGEELFDVSSIHHQMIIPNENTCVLAYATKATRKETIDGNGVLVSHTIYEGEALNDPEIMYYANLPAFCVQGHPETLDKASDFQTYYVDSIHKYLLNN